VICFDTDVMSAFVRRNGGPASLARRVGVLDASEQSTTAITVGELLFGARRRGNRHLEGVLERLIGDLHVHSFDEAAARTYASLRADLESRGQPLADADLRIAAICVSLDLTLVTGNTQHFERVPALRVENWLE
jgi:tRNA(fMet)-specific endonuclease VapC